MSDIIRFDYKDHWEEKEIILQRTNSHDEPLGFSIAGGNDKPYINDHFTSIIVTCITEDSLAYKDNQLRLYDIILRVNNIDFTNIKHKIAVHVLRTAGQTIHMNIHRLSPPISEIIELRHHKKLGISIGGGIGNEYFRGDCGIFITNIAKYQKNEQLDIGDRLLQISSAHGIYDLRFVTHKNAIELIRLACKESPIVKLYVGHTRPIRRVENQKINLSQGQYDSSGSKDEDPVPINGNNYANTLKTNVIMKSDDEEQCIQTFDFDDYQRYENRSGISRNPLLTNRSINCSSGFLIKDREQLNNTKFTTSFFLDHACKGNLRHEYDKISQGTYINTDSRIKWEAV